MKIFFVAVFGLMSLNAFATDVIHMKNGDVFRGEIVKQEFNKSVQILFKDGNEKNIRWKEIKTITKEEDEVVETPSPSPSPNSVTEVKEGGKNSKTFKNDNSAYFSTLIGYGLITSTGSTGFFTGSGRLGTGLGDDDKDVLSIGLYIGHGSISQSVTLTTGGVKSFGKETDAFTPILAELITRRAWNTGVYLGARFGLTVISADIPIAGISGSGSSFTFGPVIGDEFRLSERINFDFDLSWLSVIGSDLSTNVGALHFDTVSALFIQAGLTFHW
jgi:hypothetical protein